MEAFLPLLASTPLFQGLSQQELRQALSCLGATLERYGKEETVFPVDAPARWVGIVCSGSTLIAKEDFTGNRSILTVLGPGDLFGEAFVCAGVERLPVGVTAREDSRILLLDFSKVLRSGGCTCRFHHTLIHNMMTVLSTKNVTLNQKIEVLSARSTRDKLIAYLSGVSRAVGSASFTIPLNRQQLADYLCVDRSAMTTALSSLKREGLIDFDKNRFTLQG